MSVRRTLGVMAFSAALGLGACGGSPPPAPPEPAAAPPAPAPRAPAPAPDNSADAARRAAEEAAREAARKRAVLEEMVFFDFDMSTIREDSRRTLDAKVQVLRAEPAIRIRIQGHADDRGSTEYNLALGSRRANAILEYFTGFGLAASRFEVVSYGESRPLQQGSNEAAWSRNRRGQFEVLAGLATNQ